MLGEDQLKWTSKLLGLNFEVKYRPGRDNSIVDVLSRQMMLQGLSVVQSSF